MEVQAYFSLSNCFNEDKIEEVSFVNKSCERIKAHVFSLVKSDFFFVFESNYEPDSLENITADFEGFDFQDMQDAQVVEIDSFGYQCCSSKAESFELFLKQYQFEMLFDCDFEHIDVCVFDSSVTEFNLNPKYVEEKSSEDDENLPD